MKRVISILLCLLVAICTLASCDAILGGEEPHTHTFETKWSFDAQGHWYNATCDCEDIEVTKLGHTDLNNDGACDICTFTNHTHTYETEFWTADCTNHWRAASCGHTVEGSDVAPHADGNADGKCDDCNYIIKDLHNHIYSADWSHDGSYHWHAAICEHEVEIADKKEHNIDAAGYCTVCDAKINEIDKTDILAVLQAAVARNDKIIDGRVQMVEDNGSQNVYFVLGNGQSYKQIKSYDAAGNEIGIEQQWFELVGEENVFAVALEHNSFDLVPRTGSMQQLNGCTYFPGSILGKASDDTSTLSGTILGLYNIMKTADNVSLAEENYDALTGEYTFSYTYFTVDPRMSGGEIYEYYVELYYTDVMFTVNEDGIIDYSVFTVISQRNMENDIDLDYDPDTNEITLRDDATPYTYAYEVIQHSGERTFTTPYPRSSLAPTDFEFSYTHQDDINWDEAYNPIFLKKTPVGDSMTFTSGEYAYFQLGNPIPSFTSFDFITSEDFEYSFVNKDENSTAKMWYTTSVDEMLNGYSAYTNCLKLKIRDPGEYIVTIKFGDITKVFEATVLEEGSLVANDDGDPSTLNLATNDINGWDEVYTYTAPVAGTYTFTVPAGLGFWSSKAYDRNSAPEVDCYDNDNPDALDGGDVTVYIGEGESYSFHYGSREKAIWVINVSYAEGGTPGVGEPQIPTSELVIGRNHIAGTSVAWTYTAEEAGTLTLTMGTVVGGDVALSYTINDGTSVTLDLSESGEISLNADDILEITVIATGNTEITASFEANS